MQVACIYTTNYENFHISIIYHAGAICLIMQNTANAC